MIQKLFTTHLFGPGGILFWKGLRSLPCQIYIIWEQNLLKQCNVITFVTGVDWIEKGFCQNLDLLWCCMGSPTCFPNVYGSQRRSQFIHYTYYYNGKLKYHNRRGKREHFLHYLSVIGNCLAAQQLKTGRSLISGNILIANKRRPSSSLHRL